MNKETKILAGSALAASLIAGLALATPTIGAWYNNVLATGTVNRDVHAHAHVALPGTEDGFSAELETDGAANFIQQEIKFSPLGTTGWHDLKAEDGTIALDLEKVVYVLVDTEGHRVGFGT